MSGAAQRFVEEAATTRWGRRVLTFSAVPLVTVLALALLPIVLLAAGLRDLRRPKRPTLRLALFGVIYGVAECLGLVAAGALWVAFAGGLGPLRAPYLRANFRLQKLWAGGLLAAVRRIFDVSVHVENEAAAAAGGPLLVFARHASLADTLLPAVLLTDRHGLRLRYVLKRELLFDPCLDLIGQRLPNVFVRRGSGEAEREIAAITRLASDLAADEGVLIYPEGTRFTPTRRARALERIAVSGDVERLERARAFRNVLPPRSRGPLALLDACPQTDVLLLAHVGFDGLAKLTDLLEGALVGREIRVRLERVAASEIPKEPVQRLEWLDRTWARLDGWIGALHAEAREGAS